jgi:hypothetical protein
MAKLKHTVHDTDTHFSIDPITRTLKNETCPKNVLIQHDHNSERFTFELPRYIEGHDMSKCDVAQVHFLNIDVQTKEQSSGVYEIEDLGISPDGDDVVICSWLISGNATKYVGSLNFLLRFSCVKDDGTVYYVWNTAIYSTIQVSSGIYNGDVVFEEYSDILAQWHHQLFDTVEGGVADVEAARQTALDDITREKNNATRSIYAQGEQVRDSLPLEYGDLVTQTFGESEKQVISQKTVTEGMQALNNVMPRREITGRLLQLESAIPPSLVGMITDNSIIHICNKNIYFPANINEYYVAAGEIVAAGPGFLTLGAKAKVMVRNFPIPTSKPFSISADNLSKIGLRLNGDDDLPVILPELGAYDDVAGHIIDATKAAAGIDLTPYENVQYANLYFYNDTDKEVTYDNIQLEYGLGATAYEPCRSQLHELRYDDAAGHYVADQSIVGYSGTTNVWGNRVFDISCYVLDDLDKVVLKKNVGADHSGQIMTVDESGEIVPKPIPEGYGYSQVDNIDVGSFGDKSYIFVYTQDGDQLQFYACSPEDVDQKIADALGPAEGYGYSQVDNINAGKSGDAYYMYIYTHAGDQLQFRAYAPEVVDQKIDAALGDIDTALDHIIAIQNKLIGGEAV